jgi:hypothetical protein
MPIVTQMSQPVRAPKVSSAATAREPSAFMTTATQLPSATFHVTVGLCPESNAAQNACCPGGVGGERPGCVRTE